VSEPSEPEIDVPPGVRAGVWANHVDVYGDIEELTLDFAQLDPRDAARGIVVARIIAARPCIIELMHALEEALR
jgi:hypothetical protein